jgi:hypothetical protein
MRRQELSGGGFAGRCRRRCGRGGAGGREVVARGVRRRGRGFGSVPAATRAARAENRAAVRRSLPHTASGSAPTSRPLTPLRGEHAVQQSEDVGEAFGQGMVGRAITYAIRKNNWAEGKWSFRRGWCRPGGRAPCRAAGQGGTARPGRSGAPGRRRDRPGRRHPASAGAEGVGDQRRRQQRHGKSSGRGARRAEERTIPQ